MNTIITVKLNLVDVLFEKGMLLATLMSVRSKSDTIAFAHGLVGNVYVISFKHLAEFLAGLPVPLSFDEKKEFITSLIEDLLSNEQVRFIHFCHEQDESPLVASRFTNNCFSSPLVEAVIEGLRF